MAGRGLLTTISNVLTKHLRCSGIQRWQPITSSTGKPSAVTPGLSQLHTAAWTKPYTPSLHNNHISVPAQTQKLLSLPTPVNVQAARTRITCSQRDGKPRTVKAVTARFFRLYNGMWIRTRAGRHKKHWKKSGRRISTLQQHVMCTQRQCWMLDRMVNRYYKTPKYYPNDPYQCYHQKTNLPNYNFLKPKFLP